MTFTATRLLSSTWGARYTAPIPPPLMNLSILYLPSRSVPTYGSSTGPVESGVLSSTQMRTVASYVVPHEEHVGMAISGAHSVIRSRRSSPAIAPAVGFGSAVQDRGCGSADACWFAARMG